MKTGVKFISENYHGKNFIHCPECHIDVKLTLIFVYCLPLGHIYFIYKFTGKVWCIMENKWQENNFLKLY